ncbi:MAG: phage tail protein [Chloroflexi bacterium]|nr:phage tail protein [Chloroflexota bacterium]
MAQPFVGEIRMFAGNFAPAGWMFCEGQLLPIAEHEALFNLIGTYYGGDGINAFALPDLRGRVPIHQGTDQVSGITYFLAETGGAEEVTLTVNQIPNHSHALLGTEAFGQESNPEGKVFARTAIVDAYYSDVPNTSMNAALVSPVGGSQPHTNFQPYLCVNFIISLFGIFPSPT